MFNEMKCFKNMSHPSPHILKSQFALLKQQGYRSPVVWGILIFCFFFVIESQAEASTRSEIFRQSRNAAVLLVSRDKITSSITFGTGFFISDEGHILTNAHVLTDNSSLLIYIPGHGVFSDARRIAIDQDADLAVVHLPFAHDRALTFSRDFPEEGTEVFAAGYPRVTDTLQMGLMLHATVKPINMTGWTYGRTRTQRHVVPFLQVSGVLHSGTSGGPLVDSKSGKVLGVVVHSVPYIGKATDRQGSMIGRVLLRADISYAIPAIRITKWLAEHQIPFKISEISGEPRRAIISSDDVRGDPQKLGMSLFLTGHLTQTIAETVNGDQGFLELAVHHYQKALELLPSKFVISRNLALAYRSLQRYEEALSLYENLIEQSPSNLSILTEAAQTSMYFRDDKKAMSLYQTALEHHGCSLDALNGIGTLHFGKLEYAQAIKVFQKAVSCVPSSAYASFYLGESLARSGLTEEAFSVWNRSLKRVTRETSQEKEFYDLMHERTRSTPTLFSKVSPISKLAKTPQTVSQ